MTGFPNEDEDLRVVEADGFPCKIVRRCLEVYGSKEEALTEKLGIETRIYAFGVSSLPSVPAKWFSKLFQEKPKWEWKELQPFVRDLKVPALSSEGLLLMYTRRTQPSADAEPISSACVIIPLRVPQFWMAY
ncbi:hypothetical protein FXO38_35824 [Capsicum annuum]|nr:hypothetical protein FXO38_35824 [Capsicum annuum]KAF3653228.1 hypothetical protein FXO37_17086 [Capsicum annuum]